MVKENSTLNELAKCMRLYDVVHRMKSRSLDLGGISGGSVSTEMKYRAEKTFIFEAAVVLHTQWKGDKSVLTVYHDEMSLKVDASMSVVNHFLVCRSLRVHASFGEWKY